MTVTVSDLRDRPDFAPVVADRVWRAWWQPKGVPLDVLEGLVAENLTPEPIPFALIAHHGDTFCGTASVIASDLEEHPELGPWIAALWIDPAFRNQGHGRTLVETAAVLAFKTGVETLYLCALPALRQFYEGLGWTLVETGVGDGDLDVFADGRTTRQNQRLYRSTN